MDPQTIKIIYNYFLKIPRPKIKKFKKRFF